MAKRFQAPTTQRLADPALDRARRNHDQRIREIHAVPIVGGILVRDVQLPNATNTPIPHSFGRRAMHFHSAPRASASATTGRIREILDPSLFDQKKFVVLKANGWGETILVDVWLF